jgi:hypothetical protein
MRVQSTQGGRSSLDEQQWAGLLPPVSVARGLPAAGLAPALPVFDCSSWAWMSGLAVLPFLEFSVLIFRLLWN